MRVIKKKLTALIIMLVFFGVSLVSFGGIFGHKAEALSIDFSRWYQNSIYYFSDLDPTFNDDALGVANNLKISCYYDIHENLTSQELDYMVHSGYFFEFGDHSIAVIQIVTIKPDADVLNAFFRILHDQGCKVLFISPYFTEYEQDVPLECDSMMPCNRDDFSRFIKNSLRNMADEDGMIRDYTTLFIDRRTLDMNIGTATYDFAELCTASPLLRKIVYNIYYGCSMESNAEYGEGLYRGLWQLDEEYYMSPLGLDLNYFDEDYDPSDYLNYFYGLREFRDYNWDEWQYISAEYAENSEYAIAEYYNSVAEALRNRNIHIFIHWFENQYVDILYTEDTDTIEGDAYDKVSYNTKTYEFYDYNDVFDPDYYPNLLIKHIYAIGTWALDIDYYGLLYSIQKNLVSVSKSVQVRFKDEEITISKLPIYIWVEDPMVYDENGLEVITADGLATYYDDELVEEYDELYLKLLFTNLLVSIIDW